MSLASLDFSHLDLGCYINVFAYSLGLETKNECNKHCRIEFTSTEFNLLLSFTIFHKIKGC